MFIHTYIFIYQVYKVEFDKAPTDAQITTLAEGVVITTIAQRDTRTGTSGSKSATPLTAKTKPCKVSRIGQPQSKYVIVYLTTSGFLKTHHFFNMYLL